MSSQNYASTAVYFERRACKTSSPRRKQQFEAAAARYRLLAEQFGHRHHTPAEWPQQDRAVIPPRRKRLIQLFRTYDTSTA